MVRNLAILAFAMGAAAASSQAGSLFPGGPRYDGTFKIVSLTGSNCPVSQAGRVFGAVYRAKVLPTNIAEAMSISIPLAGALFFIAGGDGTFKGTNQSVTGSMIVDAWRQNVPNNVVNLKFTPATITSTTPDFLFIGTFQNYTIINCTAKVRGEFTLRVP